MAYCENTVPLLHLYYDYQGIESWATGEWKRNRPRHRYKESVLRQFKKRAGYFHKVKGHSGWN